MGNRMSMQIGNNLICESLVERGGRANTTHVRIMPPQFGLGSEIDPRLPRKVGAKG
jgi:hypothetical protein